MANPKGINQYTKGGTVRTSLLKSPMFSKSDYKYLRKKGYSPKEVSTIWKRDAKSGASPVKHKPIPNVVGVIGNPNFYKK